VAHAAQVARGEVRLGVQHEGKDSRATGWPATRAIHHGVQPPNRSGWPGIDAAKSPVAANSCHVTRNPSRCGGSATASHPRSRHRRVHPPAIDQHRGVAQRPGVRDHGRHELHSGRTHRASGSRTALHARSRTCRGVAPAGRCACALSRGSVANCARRQVEPRRQPARLCAPALGQPLQLPYAQSGKDAGQDHGRDQEYDVARPRPTRRRPTRASQQQQLVTQLRRRHGLLPEQGLQRARADAGAWPAKWLPM